LQQQHRKARFGGPFFGSSPGSGEVSANFGQEVRVVAEVVDHAFDEVGAEQQASAR
jgi:hypothetical protein